MDKNNLGKDWIVVENGNWRPLENGHLAVRVDATFTDDAIADLAALMRHHNIKIDSNSCGAIRNGSAGTHHLFIWCGDEVLEHKFSLHESIVEITADDIEGATND